MHNVWIRLALCNLLALLNAAGCKESTPPTSSATAGSASEPRSPPTGTLPPKVVPAATTDPIPDATVSSVPLVPPRDGVATVTAFVEAAKGESFTPLMPLFPTAEALAGCVVKSTGEKLSGRLPELIRQAKDNFERRQAQPGSCHELKPQKLFVVRTGETRVRGIGSSSAEEKEDIGGDGCRVRDVRMDVVADVQYERGETGEIHVPKLLRIGDTFFLWSTDEPACLVGPYVPVEEFARRALALPAEDDTPTMEERPAEETEEDLEHAHLQEIPAETVAAIVAGAESGAGVTGATAEGLKTAVADTIRLRVRGAKRRGDTITYPLMLGNVGSVVMGDATVSEDGSGRVAMTWYITRSSGGGRQLDQYGHTIPLDVKNWQHGVSAHWDAKLERWVF